MKHRTDIHVGPAIEKLKEMASKSMHCVITSPPYWGLRSYKGDPGMIGLEPTWDDHVENLLAVFRECRRVLRDDGTLWVNYGDAYAGGGRGQKTDGAVGRADAHNGGEHPKGWRKGGWKAKDLMMMPARLAIAMQDDDWYLRSEIIWHKPNPMPESSTDRPTNAHEKIFLFSKRPRYFYDHVAVRTGLAESTIERFGPGGRRDFRTGFRTGVAYVNQNGPLDDLNTPGKQRERWPGIGKKHAKLRNKQDQQEDMQVNAGVNLRNVWSPGKHGPNPDRRDGGRRQVAPVGSGNLRDVWKQSTHSYKDAHFATYPPKLIEPCVKAGTSEKGCCSSCGAPVVRIVEKSGGATGQSWHDHSDDATKGQRATSTKSKGGHGYRVDTTAWRKTCGCRAATVPCRVLDPFAGSGTTAIVANSLGRDAVLIEISEEYADMARRRLAASNQGD